MTDRRGHDVVDSPIGPLTLVVDEDGALCGLYMDGHRGGPPAADRIGPRRPGVGARAAEQLDDYFAGARTTFDLEVRAEGSAFQHAVWDLLVTIPYGQTTSYGAIADRLGRAGSARAVGVANGANPVSIVVPCHRVIGAAGQLTGYGGGLDRKERLLDLERSRSAPRLPW